MTQTISRRAFVRRAALIAATIPAARWRNDEGAAPLRIGVPMSPASRLAPSDDAVARGLGIQLGIEEARHAAALFGGSVELVPATLTTLRSEGLSVLVGGADLESCLSLSRAADGARIGFMNVSCSDDRLRGGDCRATTFHVAPSDAMYRDALQQAHASAGAGPTAWDPSLARFGANTLNGRFRARFKRPMTSPAWLGWVAVKIAWESSLRAGSTDARTLMQYMASDGAQFDGHKGRALSFRSWDHQLRQPVYVVDRSNSGRARTVAEMPGAGPAGETSRDALDRLGTPAAASACRLSP